MATNSIEHYANMELKKKMGTRTDPQICGITIKPYVHYPIQVTNTDGKRRAEPAMLMNTTNSQNEDMFVTEQIFQWRKSGALHIFRKQDELSPKIATPITVAIKDDKRRMCNDGGLWKIVQKEKVPCKLDSIMGALRYLKKGDLMTKTDDKSGFHHLLLEPESSDLAIQWWGNYFFKFKAAAFGYSIVPGMYQMANMAIVNYLRRRYNIPVWLYLDDRLFVHRPKNEEERQKLLNGELDPIEAIIAAIIQIIMGGFISLKKSQFKPSTIIEFLGFIINTMTETVEIPKEKWEKFKQEVLEILASNPTVDMKLLEQLRGKMCSFLIVATNMRLYIRETTRTLMENEKLGNSHAELSPENVAELELWISTEFEVIKKVRKWPQLERIVAEPMIVWTDACPFAMGIKCDFLEAEETIYFTKKQADYFIHHKEALAILIFLEKFKSKLENKDILFKCDNQSVEACFHVGSKDKLLNEIITAINLLSLKHGITSLIEWVPTHLQQADEASRITNDWNEETIIPTVYEMLQFVTKLDFTVDACATRANRVSEDIEFIARYHDDLAMAKDIFTVKDWGQHVIYCFPPRAIVHHVARHLKNTAFGNTWCLIFHAIGEYPDWIVEFPDDLIFDLQQKIEQHSGLEQMPMTMIPTKQKDPKYGYYTPNKDNVKICCIIHYRR